MKNVINKILSMYFDNNDESTLSNFTDKLISEVVFACKYINKHFNYSINEAKQIILNFPKLAPFNVNTFLEIEKNLKQQFALNYNELADIFKNNAYLFIEKSANMQDYYSKISKTITISRKDFVKIMQNNNIYSISTKEFVSKFNTIQKELNLSKYSTTLLCRISKILSLSEEDLINNIKLASTLNYATDILNNYTIFNCSYKENISKLKLLTSIGIAQSLLYVSNIKYAELYNRLKIVKNKLPISPQLIVLPEPQFLKYINHHKTIFQYNYFTKAITIKKHFTFNKSLTDIITLPKTQFFFQIGKRCKISKEDKINAKIQCKNHILTKNPFNNSLVLQNTPNKQHQDKICNNFKDSIIKQLRKKERGQFPF